MLLTKNSCCNMGGSLQVGIAISLQAQDGSSRRNIFITNPFVSTFSS